VDAMMGVIIDHGLLASNAAARPIKLTKTVQVRMVGNSVSPPPAEAIVRAQFAAAPMEAVA
jgi:site-specific DNA-cytosine methylase